jgi:hypothetical protein
LGGAAHYAHGSGNRTGHTDHSFPPPFSGQIITNCKANKKTDCKDKSIPLEGIMTRTEFRRDVESIGGNSSSDLDISDKRESSTEGIRQEIREAPP